MKHIRAVRAVPIAVALNGCGEQGRRSIGRQSVPPKPISRFFRAEGARALCQHRHASTCGMSRHPVMAVVTRPAGLSHITTGLAPVG
jgi:hypothetical protein